ncbi:hypothetical protein AMK16_25155 [Streptomyces sp. CB00455]|nr:hypothetical protein AMK16_25155 [Streptomyces sp. CB00455]
MLVLTACGSSTPTAADVFAKSRKAAERVRSSSVSAHLTLEDGRSVMGGLFVDDHGSCEGDLTFPRAGTATVLVVGARVYVKGDDGYLESLFAEGERDRLRGSWADFDVSDPLVQPITAVCEAARPMTPFRLDRSATVLDSASYIDTQPVAVFKTPGPGGGTVTESVSAKGKPYILERSEFGGKGSLSLSRMTYSTRLEPPVAPPAQGVLPAHRDGVAA